MKLDIQGSLYIDTGEIKTVHPQDLQEEILGDIVYEVIRVIDGKLIFGKEHLDRLSHSLQLFGIQDTPWQKDLANHLCLAPDVFGIDSQNLKIVCAHLHENQPRWLIYPVVSTYPPESWYDRGVRTQTLALERENPEAKVLHRSLKDQVAQLMETNHIWEALLVNGKGHITEGSRSNLFFIKEGRVVTARGKDVLGGITRHKVLEALDILGIPHGEEDIRLEDLKDMEGLFLTGTSIHVLPIQEVDHLSFGTASHPLYKAIANQFEAFISDIAGGA